MEGKEIEQTDACLICGEPWSQDRPTDVTVLIVGESIEHTWLSHRECLERAADPRFANRFTKPS